MFSPKEKRKFNQIKCGYVEYCSIGCLFSLFSLFGLNLSAKLKFFPKLVFLFFLSLKANNKLTIFSNVLLSHRGGYSSVVLGTHMTTRQKYAIKIIDKSKLVDNVLLQERVKRECDINMRISHPHIARVFEIYESAEDVCLIVELLEGGELFDHIATCGRMTEETARPLIRDIFDAVNYLHSLGIAHRDLKVCFRKNPNN